MSLIGQKILATSTLSDSMKSGESQPGGAEWWIALPVTVCNKRHFWLPDCQTPKKEQLTVWMNSLKYGGNNDLSMRCSLAFIFDPGILAWADTLDQELCLFICFVLVTFSLHALAMYSYHYVLQVSPDDFYTVT